MRVEAHPNLAFVVNPKNGKPSGMISDATYKTIMANAEKLNSEVIYDRDFSYVSCTFRFWMLVKIGSLPYSLLLAITELLWIQDP